MADKEKFMDPQKKKYGIVKNLSKDRIANAIYTMVGVETELWKTVSNEEYEKMEPAFDTAITALMAIAAGVAEIDINK